MLPSISKLCADSLRNFTDEKYHIKLKAAHAHELVAAFFGYSSKNAMLADTEYPINNLHQAEVIVMTSDAFIDQRRKELRDLSPELPDSYTLGEGIYVSLFSDRFWASPYPPFRSFEKLAKYLVERNDALQIPFKISHNVPVHHILDEQTTKNGKLLTVWHSHQTSSDDLLADGSTTIELSYVAGRIGYGKAKVSVEKWTGGARKTLETKGVQL